jgi:hypothetical protein
MLVELPPPIIQLTLSDAVSATNGKRHERMRQSISQIYCVLKLWENA